MSLIVYIFSVFFPCRRNSSALRVRGAGHALNLNKGCTKRQSLPNCQQNGRPGREYRPGKQDARCYFVRNGAATKVRRGGHFCGKTDRRNPLRNDTASSSRRHAGRDSADTKAVIRTERQRKEARRDGRRGTDKGDGVRATQRAMNSGRQRMDDGQQTTGGKGWTTGDGQQAASAGRWTAQRATDNKRQAMDDERKNKK